MKPTVGRQVHYWPTRGELPPRLRGVEGDDKNNVQPLAATICFVHADGEVNLSVLDATGQAHTRERVRLPAPNQARQENTRCCTWPVRE